MDRLSDAHYVALPSQGNVYSLAPLRLPTRAFKILVSSLRRKVLSFKYSFTQDDAVLKPIVREVLFTYIPSGAEIISIDAFSKSEPGEDFVIGITIIKAGNDGTRNETYLNTYTKQDWDEDCGGGSVEQETGVDSAAQNCSMLELTFIPYQLTHVSLPLSKETVWLLGGDDCRIHVFQEDAVQHCYNEVAPDTLFPEFSIALPSPPLWTDIQYTSDEQRLTATGCECGYLTVSKVKVSQKNSRIEANWDLQLSGPITCVHFFSLHNRFFWQDNDDSTQGNTAVNLLVSCATQPSQVFMNVVSLGLHSCSKLEDSATGDAVLCGLAADINLDGQVELLLGTYGRELIVYRWAKDDIDGAGEGESEGKDKGADAGGRWQLDARRSLPHPVHGLLYLDMTGDGARELVVLTPKGLHVFQHKMEDIQQHLEEFLRDVIPVSNEATKSSHLDAGDLELCS